MMGPFGKFGSLEAWFIRRPSGRTIHDSRFSAAGARQPRARAAASTRALRRWPFSTCDTKHRLNPNSRARALTPSHRLTRRTRRSFRSTISASLLCYNVRNEANSLPELLNKMPQCLAVVKQFPKQGVIMTNGELIRLLRQKAGVKAIDLAKMLGVTRSYISQVENGQSAASDELLNRVCKVLNIDKPESFVSVSGNHGALAVGSPGAKGHNTAAPTPSGGEPPAWAEALRDELRGELARLRGQLADIQALLVKLAGK